MVCRHKHVYYYIIITLTEGPAFSAKYSVLLNKWRTRLSVALHREVANAIIAGARNARGGAREGLSG